MAEHHILIQKLDHFIRKYYKNRLIRGLLWSVTLLAAFYLVFVSMEYAFYFNQAVRAVFFFTFLSLFLFLFTRLILIPLFQLARIGKIISHEQAARIIGTHFSEIQDKLLNTLQLIRQKETGSEAPELLSASIDQKTGELKVFRFTRVIDLRKNLRYMRYALIPVVIILLLVVLSPKTISDPTERLIRFSTPFERPALFTIGILNKNLTAVQQDDFNLEVKVTGTEIPADLYIKTPEGTYKMIRNKGFVFAYTFKSVQSSIPFRFVTGDYSSAGYELKVFPKPTILNFDVVIDYPGYIGKPQEKTENQGDFIVPEGSVLTWKFYTKDVTGIRMRFDNETIFPEKQGRNTYSYSAKLLKPVHYSITPQNENTYLSDSLRYRINVVSDGYPSVFLTENADSMMPTTIFFRGTIKDDYGFSRLMFHYMIYTKEDTAAGLNRSEQIPIERQVNNQVFYYAIDLLQLLPEAGQNIRYYFEIWDNDGIRGPKATKSEVREIRTPTLNEIAERADENAEKMNLDLEESLRDARAMKKTMDELNKKLVDQSAVSWQEKKKVEDLLKASQAIEEKIEQIKKRNNENIQSGEKYLESSERILEKQRQLNELLDQMMTDEMKKMLQEIRDMLNQLDKEKLGNMLEKMKMTNKDLETQLDRNLEMMKQIEFDRKLEMTVNDLRKTAEKQEKLAEETQKETQSTEQLVNKQAEISQKTDSLFKKIEELQQEGKQLENPAELGDTKSKEDSIRKSLSESSDKLQQKKNKEASGSQKKGAQQMKDLAQQMEESQAENEDEQAEEDADNIRKILENLVRLSFDEEAMISQSRQIGRNDPKYVELVYRQKEFGDKMKVVEDSLNAIAKRQIMIKPVIGREIAAINQNTKLALEAMDTRNTQVAVTRQQYIMTAINNLALLLNESLQKMNQQMQANMKMKSGSKSCNNPSSGGKGKMSAKSMKDLQGKIGEQLKKLKSEMEGKKNPNGPKSGQGSFSKELARLAAQQEALRNAMQKYQDEMGTKGLKDQGSMNEAAKEMEQIERDLINKQITQETLRRQERILTRLLESEKAEQMREQEEKRESTEAKNHKSSNPGLNYQYNMKKRASQDNLQLVLPGVNSFYKSKINSYIVKIEN